MGAMRSRGRVGRADVVSCGLRSEGLQKSAKIGRRKISTRK